MRAGELQSRRSLDLVFGMVLASGVCVGAVGLLAVRDWVWPQGEGAMELYIYGLLSFIPSILACLATSLLTLLGSQDRGVRLAAVLATGHLAWWLIFVGLLMLFHKSPRVLIIASIIVEPILFGAGATYLAVHWFRRRGDYPEHVTAGG